MNTLFVYGTLKKNESMNKMLEGVTSFLGNGRIHGRLLEGTDYPAVVPDKGHWVDGEVYALHDEDATLKEVDEYEECSWNIRKPHLYKRTKAIVYMDDGTHVESWVYFFNEDNADGP